MQAQNKVNILIVDDRPENLISLAAILDMPDYNLITAESGQEALKRLLEDDFALILLDIQMPIMDGFETATIIKQREKSKHVPIIFVTAVGNDMPFLFKGYSAGAVDYIVKPFDPIILRSKVSVFADLYRKTQQLKHQAQILLENERLSKEREIARLELEGLKRETMANEKYKDLVDGIKNGAVWAADLETLGFTFISSQANRIFDAYSVEDSLREALLNSQAFKDQRNEIIESYKNGFQLKWDISFEHKWVRADKKTIWFQTGVRLSTNSAGKPELRGLSVDITAIKTAQEEAQHAIKMRDEFLSIASHELKTPLTPLRLHFDILQRLVNKEVSGEAVLGRLPVFLDRSRRQVDRLTKLIDELLDVSRITSGKMIIEVEDFDLSGLTKEVCERFRQNPLGPALSFEYFLAPRIQGAWDRLKIEQVVTNLITNAIKCGEGRKIEIHTALQGGKAVIQIKDNGIGIKEEDQQRIFDLYERAVSPMNFGGLGLGLYIVKQIVEAHGGTISVESMLGEGSMFTVKMPIRNAKNKTSMMQDSGDGLLKVLEVKGLGMEVGNT